MIQRILDFYQRNAEHQDDTASAMWRGILKHRQSKFIAALESGDKSGVIEFLNNMASTGGAFGMEGSCWSSLVMLAQKTGVLACPNPDQPVKHEPMNSEEVGDLRLKIEDVLGFSIQCRDCFGFPETLPGPDPCHRFWYYCCAAHSVLQHVQTLRGKSVLEIGAGLGASGLTFQRMESLSYTVIDLPSNATLSAFFIATCLGEDHVWLEGEDFKGQFGRWYSSGNYDGCKVQAYDVVFNMDSFPEIPAIEQEKYLSLIAKTLAPGGVFISINHESPEYAQRRTLDAVNASGLLKIRSRHPFWPRPGYVEEVYCLASKDL